MWECNPWTNGQDDGRGALAVVCSIRSEFPSFQLMFVKCKIEQNVDRFPSVDRNSLLFFLLLFFAPGNGQRWAKGDEKEFDQRGCQGPPDGHHRRHSDRPIYLWKMQGEMLHLHTGTHCYICHPNYASTLGFLSGSPRKSHIKSSELKYTAQQKEGSIWWLQFNSTRQSHFLEAGSNNDCKVLAAFVQMRQPTGE